MGSVDPKELLVLLISANMKAFIILALVAAVYAESEAEADPAYLYAGYYGYPYAYAHYGYAGHGYYGYPALKSAPCVNAANQPVPCAGRKRRDAEADAEADPAAYWYGGYYGLGYGYGRYPYGLGYGYAGYPVAGVAGWGYHGQPAIKSAPCVNAANQPVPCAQKMQKKCIYYHYHYVVLPSVPENLA